MPFNAAARSEPAATATTSPIAPSRVRCNATIPMTVASPTASDATSTSRRWARSSRAARTRLSASASYPVKSPSWPSTMLMPTAVMNPVITELDTKRSIRPRRNSPATTMITPVSTDSVARARAGSS